MFDCRCLPNPGRDGRNADKTGFDEGVIQELESSPEVQAFLRSCSELILQAVKKYRERGFEHLMISFGCTGGQHRSVYFANHFARALVGPDIQIELEHQSLKEKGFLKGDIQ